MSNLLALNFVPEQVEDMDDGFTVVDPGIYTVVIIESDLKDTQKGGKMLVLKYQIMDGQYIGSVLTDRINIVNSSDTAQKIGRSQLKSVCDAIGHKGLLENSAQLHGKPYSVKVAVVEFESNKEPGKMLKSNHIEKRMAKITPGAAPATPATQAPASSW